MKSTGGGQKINLFREEVEKYKNDHEKIIIFTDSYDVIFLAGLNDILEQFDKIGGRVVFGAEPFCWPDKNLASQYPIQSRGKQYLNSGGIIGYAPELYEILTHRSIDDDDDDQLFYTQAYLNETLRNNLKIKLDHKSQIFHNLHGAMDELSLKFKNHEPYLENEQMKSHPLILHGNGPTVVKVGLNNLGNYLPNCWNTRDGCVSCKENVITLSDEDTSNHPRVFVALFVSKPTPFLEDFLQKVGDLKYPKNKINLFVYNFIKHHERDVDKFVGKFREKYKSVKEIKADDEIAESHAKTLAIEHFKTSKADFYFNLDSEAHLDNPYTLKLLVEQNRTIVAPMLVRPFKAWSNFWGGIAEDGFYARSFDYMDLVNNEKRGLWNVPYISGCYLINGTVIRNDETKPSYVEGALDPDMAFCHHMREKGVFMYVSNRVDFGHLINPDTYDVTRTHPDFYQIFDNKWDWEQRYLHENYSENLNPETKPLMPCPDVYWFPIASPRFCQELIEICETYGKWSDGSNKDLRLDGGYENVPTRDIHMKQIGLEYHWLYFLKEYVRPLQENVFIGYYHNPPRAIMNFVVRYKPDEQPSLRPHHDSSTYTINLALNTPKVDYEGGGCRFLRYNCSVTDTRLGWLLMHPGRLTHYHEGLLVTKGTRYIMVSFVDP
ncbi:Procollagen-lysine,2-oxoglutarate 5-dioxygenase 3 precursor, putative [Pediculus humanus corporis]|uniref:Procollagen-lysine,2-oxoglutarate 5-dioxygenase 3, putative n=1 Tax=Pediculus humanus subsp. corporis TaxID=121224 RepID=E0VRF9_PEDHC|nr:Procollagen-lysine,2-oxoglutarate 5-dioxygenase 3 precursor, putative [Pediculus humanus corporis]EEB15965.1 Procollagen-lysine,2-oxoglutarate 5-dioxygenase 3 precursor, putative [Pediculus humanus corporis]